MKTYIYRNLVEPRSLQLDDRRRELILNVLLCGLFIVSSLAIVAGLYSLADNQFMHGYTTLIITLLAPLVLLAAWKLNRSGHQLLISYILLAMLGSLALSFILNWSFELPIAELLFGLMIVAAGVLLSAKAAIRFNGLAILLFVVIGYAQISGSLHPRLDWLDAKLIISDVVGYATIFGIIALISWLANREIDRSLERAHNSEADLALERDSLEVKVVERTKQLEQAQFLRNLALHRLADFGRVGANFVHDVANPLTAVSLALEQVENQTSPLLMQARSGVGQMERYVIAARKQLQSQSSKATFEVSLELTHVLQLIQPLAKANNITITLNQVLDFQLYGDSVKFNQMVSNLLYNAIDAYADSVASSKEITIDVQQVNRWLVITVTDWGIGINAEQLPKIFDLFYSTKDVENRGLGIGLDIVKQFAEIDFKGSVSATSSETAGTSLTLRLKLPKGVASHD